MTESQAKYSRVTHYRVSSDRAGQRLDNLLMGQLKGVPKAHLYRLIRRGQVRVNGRRCKPGQRLEGGDQVRIPPLQVGVRDAVTSIGADIVQRLRKAILWHDQNYLVIDKPAGMAVHSGSGLRWGVIDVLRQMGDYGQEIELIHRLDRDTSGVLLVARRRQALLAAQQALRSGSLRKRYLAIMIGKLRPTPVTVTAPLRKLSGRDRRAQVIVDADGGKAAKTTFTVLEAGRHWSFVEALIETGRTHQIRVHAAHLGHSLLGDRLYTERALAKAWPGPVVPRLCLHCVEMSMPDTDGMEGLLAHAPLPPELQGLLDELPR